MVDGQFNLASAVHREIDYVDPQSGREYRLNDKTAVLFVRPRGWHLPEKHMTVDGVPMSGSLFDFGLYFFHNAKELGARQRPYSTCPKWRVHLEARLWNASSPCPGRARRAAEVDQGHRSDRDHPRGFEMDEILWELRDHSAGLILRRGIHLQLHQKSAEQEWSVLPTSAQVHDRALPAQLQPAPDQDLPSPRGSMPMGGMAAQIPIRTIRRQ